MGLKVHEIWRFFAWVITFYVGHNIVSSYWVFHIGVCYGTIHLRYTFLLLVAYRYQLAIPILLLSFSVMPGMLLLMSTKICRMEVISYYALVVEVFKYYVPIVLYHFALIDQDNLLGFVFQSILSFFLYACIHHLQYLPLSEYC